MSHLPDSNVGSWFRERPLEHATHLESVRVHLCDVVENDQDGGQWVDAGEETDVAEQQEELQVVVESALSEHDTHTQDDEDAHSFVAVLKPTNCCE